VDSELCNGCKRCLRAGCIALTLVAGEEDNQVVIDEAQCNGCEVCAQLCRFDAISFPATVEA
jgi:indolepyruvate ferredoxin oxidoreductase, alpha subunit